MTLSGDLAEPACVGKPRHRGRSMAGHFVRTGVCLAGDGLRLTPDEGGPAVIETMTQVGLDVHAGSTHAAAIDVASGELRRARFGGGSDEVTAATANPHSSALPSNRHHLGAPPGP